MTDPTTPAPVKFVPFEPPPTDYHGLASGVGNEGGVNAKAFVEGVNRYLGHLFSVVATPAKSLDALWERMVATFASTTVVKDLEARIAALENKPATPQVAATPAPVNAPVPSAQPAPAPTPAPAPVVVGTTVTGVSGTGAAGTQAAPASADPLAAAIKPAG